MSAASYPPPSSQLAIGQTPLNAFDDVQRSLPTLSRNSILPDRARTLLHEAVARHVAHALDDFLAASRPTHCTMVDRDRWGRIVATCVRNDGTDVNEWLVRQGWALDWPRYSGGVYQNVQEEARSNRRGVWQGEFVDPEDWRDGIRLDWTFASEPFDPDCVIKGNINARGERIYHVPGGQFYDQTVIDEAAGQHWFCSEDEARNAGWRPSRR